MKGCLPGFMGGEMVHRPFQCGKLGSSAIQSPAQDGETPPEG